MCPFLYHSPLTDQNGPVLFSHPNSQSNIKGKLLQNKVLTDLYNSPEDRQDVKCCSMGGAAACFPPCVRWCLSQSERKAYTVWRLVGPSTAAVSALDQIHILHTHTVRESGVSWDMFFYIQHHYVKGNIVFFLTKIPIYILECCVYCLDVPIRR